MQSQGQEQPLAGEPLQQREQEPSEQPEQPAQPMECTGNGAGNADGAGEAQCDGAAIDPEQERHAQEEQERLAAAEKAALEERAALAKKEEERRADLAVVIKAVGELDGIPDTARDTLLLGLPYAFVAIEEGDGKAPAHKMQASFIELITGALEDARAQAERGAEEAGGAASAAEQELQACEKEIAEKVENAKAARAEAEVKAAASVASLKRVREAEGEHKKAKKSGLAAAKVWSQLREQRERAATLAKGPLDMLIRADWENVAKARHLTALQELMKQMKVGAVLADAAPLALAVPPPKRARFDDVVVAELTEAVNSGLSALNKQVESIAHEEEESRALTLGLWALADVRRGRAEEAEKAHKCAQAEVGNADADIARAEERLAKQKESISSFASQRTDLEAKADEIRNATTAVARLQSVH